jgi:WS/DGAT/MGAT family acyltransferase
MSGIDPMFIYSETAVSPMEVAYACVFDPATAPGGYSFDSVRDHLAARLPTLPAFRRRLMTVPMGLDHPRWVDDPEFDLGNHLHRAALPATEGGEGLSDLVADVMGHPLDPDQAPWEMHVIEGLDDGRIGLIAKVHHSLLDGVSGSRMLAQLLDISPEGTVATEVVEPWQPPTAPSGMRLITEALPNLLGSPLRVIRAAREVGRTTLRLAGHAARGGTAGLSIPLGAPAPFSTPMKADRAVSFAELSLAQVQELRDRLGLTVNDVVLAACAGALRTYLSEHDMETSDPLVAVVPVSVRGHSEYDALGNQLSAMFVPLPNDLARPLDRLRGVVAASKLAKAQERAVGYGAMASAVAEAFPPAVARPAVQLGVHFGAVRRLRPGNLVVSNVPGPKFPLFFAGMRLEAVHPIGPVVEGVALNITVQSYLSTLFVGLNACPSVVPDLPALARYMVDELALMTEAARAESRVLQEFERNDRSAEGTPRPVVRSVPRDVAATPHAAALMARPRRPRTPARQRPARQLVTARAQVRPARPVTFGVPCLENEAGD